MTLTDYEGYPPDVGEDWDLDHCPHKNVQHVANMNLCWDCGLCVCSSCVEKRGY